MKVSGLRTRSDSPPTAMRQVSPCTRFSWPKRSPAPTASESTNQKPALCRLRRYSAPGLPKPAMSRMPVMSLAPCPHPLPSPAGGRGGVIVALRATTPLNETGDQADSWHVIARVDDTRAANLAQVPLLLLRRLLVAGGGRCRGLGGIASCRRGRGRALGRYRALGGHGHFLDFLADCLRGHHGVVVLLAELQLRNLHARRQLQAGQVDHVAEREFAQVEVDVLGEVPGQARHFDFGEGVREH